MDFSFFSVSLKIKNKIKTFLLDCNLPFFLILIIKLYKSIKLKIKKELNLLKKVKYLKKMEHSKVNKELKYLTTNGVTLNPDEKMNISLALQQLQCELNFEELLLWGKISGMST